MTELPNHTKDLRILSTGEVIPAGLWLGRYEEDGDYCVYYVSKDGREYGTHSGDCEML